MKRPPHTPTRPPFILSFILIGIFLCAFKLGATEHDLATPVERVTQGEYQEYLEARKGSNNDPALLSQVDQDEVKTDWKAAEITPFLAWKNNTAPDGYTYSLLTEQELPVSSDDEGQIPSSWCVEDATHPGSYILTGANNTSEDSRGSLPLVMKSITPTSRTSNNASEISHANSLMTSTVAIRSDEASLADASPEKTQDSWRTAKNVALGAVILLAIALLGYAFVCYGGVEAITALLAEEGEIGGGAVGEEAASGAAPVQTVRATETASLRGESATTTKFGNNVKMTRAIEEQSSALNTKAQSFRDLAQQLARKKEAESTFSEVLKGMFPW